MSNIEEIVYQSYQLGKRNELFKVVTEIRDNEPYLSLSQIYEKAYDKITK
jgi:hypothetical protein